MHKINERVCGIFLIILFVIISLYILHFPHYFVDKAPDKKPTCPDEDAFYFWALMYNKGVYAVPIQDWYGGESIIEFKIRSDGLHYIDTKIYTSNTSLIVEVYYNNVKVQNALVRVGIKKGIFEEKLTDSRGIAVFNFNISDREHQIDVRYKIQNFELRARNFYRVSSIQYRFYSELYYNSNRINVHVYDTFNDSVYNANLSLIKFPLPFSDIRQIPPTGMTDSAGNYSINILLGDYILRVWKNPISMNPKVLFQSSLVNVDGKYYVVYTRAPGYSFLLGLFIRMNAESVTNIFLMGIASLSTYFLARRLFNWYVGVISTTVVMTSSIAILTAYLSGMGDYATMAFGILGMWLFTESIYILNDGDRKKVLGYLLGILAGLMLAIAISMRYSTAIILIAPFAYIILIFFKDLRSKKSFKLTFLRLIKNFIPFILGLAIIGSLILAYNNTYFHSPFSAGYSYGHRFNVVDGNISTEQRGFYRNFNPIDGIDNIPNLLHLHLLLLPILYIIPHSIIHGRKRIEVAFLAIYGLSNIVLYLCVPWVAQRTIEDMRYFSPAIPPLAILTGFSIYDTFFEHKPKNKNKKRKFWLGSSVVILILLAGIVGGTFCIDHELNRLKYEQPIPPHNLRNYIDVTIAQLLSDTKFYEGKLVRVNQATVIRILYSDVFIIKDNTTLRNVTVVTQKKYPIKVNDIIKVQGMFRREYTNPQCEWEIFIRANTEDVIIYLRPQYTPYKILDIVTQNHENESIEINNASVSYILNPRIFLVMDTSCNYELLVRSNVVVNYGDILSIRGIIIWRDKNHNNIKELSEWELAVRINTTDRIILIGKTQLYTQTTLSELLSAPLSYENRSFRLNNLSVLKVIMKNGIIVKDNTTERHITVHIEPNATSPSVIKGGDKLNVQGKFRRGFHNPNGDVNGEWEINIRKNSPDSVSFTFSDANILSKVDVLNLNLKIDKREPPPHRGKYPDIILVLVIPTLLIHYGTVATNFINKIKLKEKENSNFGLFI